MKRLAMVFGVLAAMVVASAGVAKADHGYGGHGNHGSYTGNHGSYTGNHGSYGGGYGGFTGGYGGYSHGPVNRAPAHYDYHAPSIQFHRGHVDVTPGHYDLHRTSRGRW